VCTNKYNAEYAERMKQKNADRPPVAEKRCPDCGETKPASAFHKNKRTPDGLLFYCKECWSWRGRRDKYKFSKEEFNRLVEEQAGACAISKEDVLNWHVDHDHQTGKVRGLLCGWCNTGLGQFRDNPTYFAAAIQYLA